MRSLDETLIAIEQNCTDKEDYIPFGEFKWEERWVPSAKDLRRNRGVIGGWGTSPGDGNNCDFDQSANGDAILVKGSGLFPGVFCHAAIVIYSKYSSSCSLLDRTGTTESAGILARGFGSIATRAFSGSILGH